MSYFLHVVGCHGVSLFVILGTVFNLVLVCVCVFPAQAQHEWRGTGSVGREGCCCERRRLRYGIIASLRYAAGKLQLRSAGKTDQQQEVSPSRLFSALHVVFLCSN